MNEFSPSQSLFSCIGTIFNLFPYFKPTTVNKSLTDAFALHFIPDKSFV